MRHIGCVMVLVPLLGAGSAWAVDGDGGELLRTHVETMPAEGAPEHIEGASAWLTVTEAGASMRMETRALSPGHVVTAWWVVINDPAACNASPCTPEDVIGRHADTGAEIVYADGQVVDAGGGVAFSAFLPAGPLDGGWFGNGFTRPDRAEVHLVLNDHGPLIADIAASMLTSYRGGCTDESLPPPFPETAKTHGTPGPNACQLVQDAIFVR